MEEESRILLQKFMDKIWPEYSRQLYSDLYRTYHPSTYVDSMTNPKGNFELALDTIGEAIQKGKKYGLLNSKLIVGRTDYSSNPFLPLPGLGILEGDYQKLRWIEAVLLFDRLYDIVEEFRCYCGENGVDPDCKGKCMGEFPYLYEDYNKLHNYMMELKNAGAPLDIMLTRSDALNKISLSPERAYIPTEHPHAGGMFEQVDKFLSRRLSVIRENIYNLSDGELLGESEQHQLENQMCELFNFHKHEASEHLFKWSIKDIISEIAPSPGETSDEGMDTTNLTPVSKKKMTLEQILEEIDDIAYYQDVVSDLEKGDKSWDVTKQVLKYADYWMENPNSLVSPDFPPINVVVPNKLNDGSHRISTLYALANHIDSDNPYWSEVKLPVHFYDPKNIIVEREPVNPELVVGDIVRVIDVDGEHGRMPKRFETYIVVKVGKTYPLMAMRNRGHDNEYYDIRPYPDSSTQFSELDVKSLYRGDTWVLVKDKLNEELDERNYQNPDLKPGDIVIPIDVDKSYGTMHTPDMYKRYEVISGLQIEDGGEIYYYEIEPVDLSDDDRLSGMLVGGGRRRNERLYPDHDKYKMAKEQKERTYLDKLDGMEIEIDPNESDRGQPFSWVDEETGTTTDTLLFDIDYIRTAPILTYGYDNDEPEKNELIKFDLIFKGDKSGLFLDWFSLDDTKDRKMLISHFNSIPVKDSILNIVYDKYFKLYGIQKNYLRLENVLIPDGNGVVRNVSGGRQLSEEVLDTFKVISELNKVIKVN